MSSFWSRHPIAFSIFISFRITLVFLVLYILSAYSRNKLAEYKARKYYKGLVSSGFLKVIPTDDFIKSYFNHTIIPYPTTKDVFSLWFKLFVNFFFLLFLILFYY